MILCPACKEENPPKFRLCGYCGAPLQAAAPAPPALPSLEVRKTVTIVFSDLVGSTSLGEALDAEALHEVKERYFGAMAAEIARHGGKVEKYIGDAIMAVFGLPRAHADDALRAVRAAAGMQAALVDVNAELKARFGVELANRTGVNTGEVVAKADADTDQKLATGDAVNLAARFEQAAPPQQIYFGETTWRLVRDAVEAESVGTITAKGKSQPVPAWRLVRVFGQDGVARRHDRPIVGRDAELATLSAVYDEVRTQRVTRLVTVIAEAGTGKSRLVHEMVTRIAADARTVTGRCLPYGDGITFWPLSMMLRSAAQIDDEQPPEQGLARLRAMVGDDDVADRLASVAGLSAASYPLHEINWAARSVLEFMAAQGPVVALIDDIHWAEPAFLDLIVHVLEHAEDVPLLLLAAARPELLEEHPDWGRGEGAMRLVLGPLSDAASAQLLEDHLGGAELPPSVVDRIVKAAGGNPLYAEQLLSMLIDSGALREDGGRWVRATGGGDIEVPPSIHALLEERLDRLARPERATVEPASVIGYEFEHEALCTLAPEALKPQLDEQLGKLERKQFIHTARAASLESLYRFHHHLVRETVYGGLLKRARANLHLRFVRWAEQAYEARALEMDEILAYHLEQAHRYLKDLGPLDAEGEAAGTQAAERLARAARRVFGRGDMHAAAALYGRAAALLPEDDPRRLRLLPDWAETLLERGDFARSREVLAEAESRAERVGQAHVLAAARLMRMRVRLFSAAPGEWGEEALRLAHEAIPMFALDEAHLDLARAWRLIGFVHGVAGRYGEASDAVARSTEHARVAGDARLIARNGHALASSTLLGPTPVAEAIELCEQLRADTEHDRVAQSKLMCTLAQLHAMRGAFEPARALVIEARALLRELGQGVVAASTGIDLLLVEWLAGDLAAAEEAVKADMAFLAEAGETYYLPTMAALLARAVRESGRDAEALELTRRAEQLAAADDLDSQSLWRSVRAPIVARAGQLDEAEVLARSALEMAQQSDAPTAQADALLELASVLRIAGRHDDARAAALQARALYVVKGDDVSAARCGRYCE
ncbi:MAG TPA: adenylate/guanylate cyclase domain-containing protein [Burkholderiaceae bacterium]|nr:adenylate/guanylate cyclase domain-containing protein [Burkholderiaceae bacterium]